MPTAIPTRPTAPTPYASVFDLCGVSDGCAGFGFGSTGGVVVPVLGCRWGWRSLESD